MYSGDGVYAPGVVRAEGDDAAAIAIARRARGQLVEFAVQRPARAQQLDRVVVRADRDQLQLCRLGREAAQVARDPSGEFAGIVL